MSAEQGAPGHRREDLQGLRAVAVLAVIAYHFGIPGVSGGFAGVDIFFVLSGFFITRLLMRELEEQGRVRLARFWANRAKRLLPNSLLTILVVVLGAVLLLPSYRLPVISGDAVSATAFFANFHFSAQTIDYFHLDDPASPLLHYWSLAVEEQFYLVLPLSMSVIGLAPPGGRRKAAIALLCLVILASFTASLLVIVQSQPEAYFHPQYRAWQLAVGGLIGLLFEHRSRVAGSLRSWGTAIGAAALVAGIFMLDDRFTYPGIWALAPTLGTAALIFGVDSGRFSSGMARVLSLPPMVWLGDLSYSLYLWHWPVAVFQSSLWPNAGGWGIMVGLAVTGLLAAAAYYLVERPFHRRSLSPLKLPRTLVVGGGSIALVVAAAFGAGALPGRSNPEATVRIAEATADLGENYSNGCHLGFDDIDQPECSFGVSGGGRASYCSAIAMPPNGLRP